MNELFADARHVMEALASLVDGLTRALEGAAAGRDRAWLRPLLVLSAEIEFTLTRAPLNRVVLADESRDLRELLTRPSAERGDFAERYAAARAESRDLQALHERVLATCAESALPPVNSGAAGVKTIATATLLFVTALLASLSSSAAAAPVILATPASDPPSVGAPSSPPPSVAGPPALEPGQHFVLDPVADGALTTVGFTFSAVLGEVLSTGEIKPPPISVPASSLLAIDRGAVTQTLDPNANTYSNIALYSAVGFALLDPVLSGLRDGGDAALVDAFMYAESASLTLSLTDMTKMAVRRPRPIDYIRCPVTAQNGQTLPNSSPDCQSTDLGLSFFSGHSAIVAAIGATATYLAFIRDPRAPRPWITLVLATALTSFVSIERVRAGEHFPTDVIAGSAAGAAIGVLVPHLHRHVSESPRVWVGAAPVPGGGALAIEGRF
jgi:membrane-associated phospholipid phosphatase